MAGTVDVANLNVRYTGDATGANAAAASVKRGLDEVKQHARETGDVLKGLLGADIVKGALGGLFDVAKSSIVDYNLEIQRATVAFTSMAQGAAAAKGVILSTADATQEASNHLKDLVEFGKATPFELKQLTTASTRLQAFGFEAKAVIPTLKAIGDQAAATGIGAEGLNRVTLALGQMMAKGKIQGDELLQLTEAGIPALQALAKHFGKTTSEMNDLVSKGMVPAKEGIAAILTDIEDRVPGMMEKMSRNLPTALSNIRDAIDQNLGGATESLFKLVQEEVVRFSEFLGSDQVKGFFDGLKSAIDGIVAAMTPFADQIAIVIGAFTTGVGAVTAFGLGFNLLAAAVAAVSGPVALVSVAVGALAAAFATDFLGIRTAVTQFADTLGEMWNRAQSIFQGFTDAGEEVARVGDSFDDIASTLSELGASSEDFDAALADLLSKLPAFGDEVANIEHGLTRMLEGLMIAGRTIAAFIGDVGGLLSGDLSWDEFADGFDSLVENMSEAGDRLLSGLGETFTGILDWLEQMGTGFAEAASEWVPALWEWVKEVTPKVLTGLSEMASRVAGWIVSATGEYVSRLLEWSKAFIEWVTPMIPDMLNELMNMQGAVLGWIFEQVPALLGQLAEWGKAFWGWVEPALPGLLEALGNLGLTLLDWVVHTALPNLIDMLGGWKDAFVDWVPGAAEGLGNALGGVWDVMSSWFTQAIPAVGEFAANMGNAIVGTFSQIVARIGQLFSTLGGAKDAALKGDFKGAWDIATGAVGSLAGDIGASVAVANIKPPQVSGRGVDASPIKRPSAGDLLSRIFPGGGKPAGGGETEAAAKATGGKTDYNSLMGATGALAPGKGGGGGGGGKGKDLSKETEEEFFKRVLGYANKLAAEFRKHGVRESDIPALVGGALAIADNESLYQGIRFNPGARRSVPGSEDAYGLFQIDVIAGKYKGLPGAPFLDPDVNIKAAVEGYFLPAYRGGARTGGDLYYAPGGNGINAGDTTPGLRQRFDQQTSYWANIFKAGGSFDADKKDAWSMGDPLQHGTELISRGMDALKKLSSDYSSADTRNVEAFFQDLTFVVAAMTQAGTSIKELMAGKEHDLDVFAEYAEKSVDLIAKGTDAFNKLSDRLAIAPEDITSFMDNIVGVITALKERLSLTEEAGLDKKAETFVVVAGDALALLSAGVDALNKLAKVEVVTPEDVAGFFTNLDAVLKAYLERITTVSKETAQQSVEFLRVATDALGVVVKAGEAFKAMWSAPPVDDGMIDQFVGSIATMISKFAEANGRLNREMVKHASEFAAATEKSTKGIEGGVKGLNALWTAYPLNVPALDDFVAGVVTVTQKFAAALDAIGGRSDKANIRESATKFGETVSKVAPVIGSSVDSLNKLWTFVPPNTADVERFVDAVVMVAQTFAGSGPAMAKLSLGATMFAETAGKVTGFISSAVEGLNKLWTFIMPDEQTISDFGDAVAMVVDEFFVQSEDFTNGMLLGAKMFAEAASAVVGTLSNGVDGLTKLRRLVVPAVEDVSDFGDALAMLVDEFFVQSEDFSNGMLLGAKMFADTAGVVVGAVSNGAKAFEELRTYRERVLNVDGFMKQFRQLVQTFTDTFADLPREDVLLLPATAQAVSAAVGSFGSAVDAFDKLTSATMPNEAKVRAVFAPMKVLVEGVRDLGAEQSTDDLLVLEEFGKAAAPALGTLAPALAAFDKLHEYRSVSGGEMGGFFRNFSSLVDGVVAVAGKLNADDTDLKQLGQSGEALAKALGPLSGAASLLDKLFGFVAPDQARVDALLGGLRGIVVGFVRDLAPVLSTIPPDQKPALEAIGSVLSLVTSGGEALSKVATKMPDLGAIGTAVHSVSGLLATSVREVLAIVDGDLKGVNRGYLTESANTVKAVVEVVGAGAEALSKLAATRTINFSTLDNVVGAMGTTLLSFAGSVNEIDTKLNLSVDRIDAVAKVTGAVVSTIGSAVESLSKLTSYRSPSPYLVDRIVKDVAETTKLMAASLGDLAKNDELSAKISQANASVQTIGNAVGVFTKLQDYFEGKGDGSPNGSKRTKPYAATPQKLIDNIVGDVRALVSGFEQAMHDLDLDRVSEEVNDRMAKLGAFGELVSKVTGAAGGLLTAFGNKDAANPTAILSAMRTFFNSLPKLIGAIQEASAGLGDDELRSFTGVAGALQGIFDAFGRITGALKGVGSNQLYESVNGLVGGVRTLIGDIAGLVNKDNGSALAAVSTFLDQFVDLLTGEAPYKAGQGFVDRFVEGMTSKLAAVQNAAKSLAGALLGGEGSGGGLGESVVQSPWAMAGDTAGQRFSEALITHTEGALGRLANLVASFGKHFDTMMARIDGKAPKGGKKQPGRNATGDIVDWEDFFNGPGGWNQGAWDAGNDLPQAGNGTFNPGSFNPSGAYNQLLAFYLSPAGRKQGLALVQQQGGTLAMFGSEDEAIRWAVGNLTSGIWTPYGGWRATGLGDDNPFSGGHSGNIVSIGGKPIDFGDAGIRGGSGGIRGALFGAAEGAMVWQPTILAAGEREPEVISPLRTLTGFMETAAEDGVNAALAARPAGGSTGGGGAVDAVTLGRIVADEVAKAIKDVKLNAAVYIGERRFDDEVNDSLRRTGRYQR